jgi:chitin synthase
MSSNDPRGNKQLPAAPAPPPARSTSLRRNLSKSSQSENKPRRQRSLVRPERERNDPNNRLYHYRQRAAANANHQGPDTAPSTTGNVPPPAEQQYNMQRQPSSKSIRPLERRPTTREQFLRRGKSILGREEKQESAVLSPTGGAIDYYDDDQDSRRCCSGFNPWMTYCRILTCCIPKQVLRCVG